MKDFLSHALLATIIATLASGLGRLTAASTELRDVWGRWIRIFLDRRQVFFDRFKCRLRHPTEQSPDNEVLVRVHLDVVNFRVAGHRSAG
jgi:hypothetical protein